ncbi:MAG: hypothetical protein IT289_11345, partial [Oligoflexia bacterium]|nr:hypothetical protein [Oligoflexia bacterium]
MKYALFIGLLLSVAGCANYTAFKAVEKNAPTRTGDSVPVEVDQVPECVVDLPQAQLDGNVNSFEFK